MLHRRVEAMLQKWCWSDVTEDVAEVVLQKKLLQKIINASVASKRTSTFFLFASFLFLFFCLDVVDDDEFAWLIVIFCTWEKN